MSTQFGDFLAAHASEVAEVWTGSAAEAPGAGGRRDRGSCAEAFVAAVVRALAEDDLEPLVALYKLGDHAGLAARADLAMRHLEALCPACATVAADAAPGDGALTLAQSCGSDIAHLVRGIASTCLHTLDDRLRRPGPARAPSLSVTMHELRRPLTILNSYGQLLSTGMLGELPESAMVAVEGITASTEMMVRMVSALAELARLEDPEDRLTLDTITADELVRDAVEQVTTEAQLRDVAIDVDAVATAPLAADRRRLTLALTNLLSNAVKHGPSQSTVEVSARAQDDHVHFVVRDHGAGFPPEDSERLFHKYYRSAAERHRKVPGSGLGLFIVKTVVTRHGGTVAARSYPGRGAEFEIILPMHLEQPS